MKKVIYPGFIMLSIVALTFFACKKDNANTDDADITSVEENAQADEVFSDTFTDVSTVETEYPDLFNAAGETKIQSDNSNPSISTTCATITVAPEGNVWPKAVTFYFGENGCTGNNSNVTRKGKIIAVFTKSFKEAGSVITITFENYFVNDHKIEGTKTITNNGINAAGHPEFTINVSKSKISSTTRTFSWNSNRTIEWIKGTNMDDSFSITGSANGANSKGKEFTVSITKPLIKKTGCRFIVAGILEIKPADRLARVLDYGNGNCDDKAIVTVNGFSKEITLRK